jgi:hypothetical protein
MLALDVIFGSPIIPDLLGIIAGHLYYFLTVLHPLAGGKNILKTPMWVYPFCLLLHKVLSICCCHLKSFLFCTIMKLKFHCLCSLEFLIMKFKFSFTLFFIKQQWKHLIKMIKFHSIILPSNYTHPCFSHWLCSMYLVSDF